MNKVRITLVSIVVLAVVVVGIFFIQQTNRTPAASQTIPYTSTTTASGTTTVAVTIFSYIHSTNPSSSTSITVTDKDHPGLKLYHNEKYGFEFWYPDTWQLYIEPNGLGYYSKFEMVVAPNIVESGLYPFLVNVVEPVFANNTFRGVGGASSTISVSGIAGHEYTYDFEGSPEKAVVLPLGQYKVILGTSKNYMVFFDNTLATFNIKK